MMVKYASCPVLRLAIGVGVGVPPSTGYKVNTVVGPE